MVRGLLIRQVFVLVDLALVALIVFACGMVAIRFLKPIPKVQALATTDLASKQGTPDRFNIPDPYREYGSIPTSGLFGDAGRYDPDAEPPPVEVPTGPPEPEETQLGLILLGTTALEDFASAIIENPSAPPEQLRKTKSYEVTDEIMAGVKLTEVFPRHVILDNNGNVERLSMDDEEMKEQIASRPSPQPELGETGGGDRVTLDRQAFIQELYTNYADLVTRVKPEMARDANGNVIGVTASNISQVPLAGKLGLNDGDVLQTVNNERIDSEQKIMEMVQKYQNASSFRIGLMRDGKTVVKTYRFK